MEKGRRILWIILALGFLLVLTGLEFSLAQGKERCRQSDQARTLSGPTYCVTGDANHADH